MSHPTGKPSETPESLIKAAIALLEKPGIVPGSKEQTARAGLRAALEALGI